MSSGAISWFLGENGSMEGGITQVFDRSIQVGMYVLIEKMNATHGSRCGRRKCHA